MSTSAMISDRSHSAWMHRRCPVFAAHPRQGPRGINVNAAEQQSVPMRIYIATADALKELVGTSLAFAAVR